MDGPRIVLVHSPLTPADFWTGVRDALWDSGRRAYLGRLPDADMVHPPYWLTHAAGVAAALPDHGRVVLVGHSGAGPLLPAIGRLARNRRSDAVVAGYLFVDSDLPRDGCSRFDLFASDAEVEALRERAERGWLPRWTDQQLAPLLPDPAQRAAFVAALPRVPVAVYEEIISVPDDWPEAPCGYLSLSDGYGHSVETAAAADWPLRYLDRHHLAPLTDPGAVAAAIAILVDALDPADHHADARPQGGAP